MDNKEIPEVIKSIEIVNGTFTFSQIDEIVDAVYELEYRGGKFNKTNDRVKVRVPYGMFKSIRNALLNLGVINQDKELLYNGLEIAPFSVSDLYQRQEVLQLENTNKVLAIYYYGFEKEDNIDDCKVTEIPVFSNSTGSSRLCIPKEYTLDDLAWDTILINFYNECNKRTKEPMSFSFINTHCCSVNVALLLKNSADMYKVADQIAKELK